MNDIQIFSSEEFGKIRTILVNDEPMFCLVDVCRALDLEQVSRVKSRLKQDGVTTSKVIDSLGRTQQATFINEPNLYKSVFQSRKQNAERFVDWITEDVLPSIRKTGSYSMTMTDEEKIQLIAKGNIKLNERIDKVEAQILTLENDVPLYGCEIEEVQKHINRRVVSLLGEKTSNAYKDKNIRASVFSDIYRQLKREYGCISTYKSIRRKYIADVHDFIDCYEPPKVLTEKIMYANAQLGF